MEFLFQHFLVISSVLLGCVASYNDTLCEKLRGCITAEIMGAIQDRAKLCVLMPGYLACTHKYKQHCRPEQAQRLAAGMKVLEDHAEKCYQCAPEFAKCLTPEFKALKDKAGKEEELCRQAPEIIGCMDSAIDEHCNNQAPPELKEMAAELKRMRSNLRCNAGSSRLAYGIGQLSVAVLTVLLRWLHH
ncbi:unnamed protein product [Lymnaea stagnalis]|uniref:Secreted protein n=1 Tax=Lymnaea stagnalis TaxID=6523 RepID=A0AAV2I6K9_LYMST